MRRVLFLKDAEVTDSKSKKKISYKKGETPLLEDEMIFMLGEVGVIRLNESLSGEEMARFLSGRMFYRG